MNFLVTFLATNVADLALTGIKLGLIMSIMTLGVHISYRILDAADLSIEGVFPLGACLAGILIYFHVPAILATIIACIGGAVGGLITGLLHTKLKIPMILSGIITMTGLYSINLALLGFSDENVLTMKSMTFGFKNGLYGKFRDLMNSIGFSNNLSNPIATLLISLVCLLLVFMIIYYFFGTEVGMGIRATGNNDTMARAQGINTNKMILLGLMISNALIALAGSLFAQNAGTSLVDSGRGMIVVGLASIIIGEAIFGRKSYKLQLVSIVTGTIIYYILRQIAIELNVVEFLDLVSAILIVIILAVPLIKKMSLSKKGGLKDARN